METFIQPKITGYRQLTEAEAALMNEGKALAEAAQLVQANALACADGSMLQVYLASNAAAVRALKDKP